MSEYKAIDTPAAGTFYGRDCIYLKTVDVGYEERKIVLKGSINNVLSSKIKEEGFSKYQLIFFNVLAFKIIELDSWDETIGDDIF